MAIIEIGDVVALKSGSLPMTVVAIDQDRQEVVLCYCDLNASILRESLPLDCIDETSKRWSAGLGDQDIYEDDEFGE